MSKQQKKLSEKKHKMVHNFLTRNFPSCEVKYDGVEGVDHRIIFNGKTTYLETKSCKRTIKAGIKQIPNRPILKQKFRLGRFKFDKEKKYPYKLSQHEDLIGQGGWYIFVVGLRIRGAPAKTIDQRLKGDWTEKYAPWDKIVFMCYPNWLEQLKEEVYGIKETTLKERAPEKKMFEVE